MKISETGINLIKSFEGCSLTAYKCPAGVWTIGYGTTEKINGQKPFFGMEITQKQADDLLISHLKTYEDAVNKLGVELNQNQFDALTSFCYNLGPYIFKGRLLDAIKACDWESVSEQLLLYNKGGGVVLAGLVRRRKAEVELFNKPFVKEDIELAAACSKIIKSGVAINYNSWKRVDLIKLNNVPALLVKFGGIDKLVADKVITSKDIWIAKKYTTDNVRSLIIKYAAFI